MILTPGISIFHSAIYSLSGDNGGLMTPEALRRTSPEGKKRMHERQSEVIVNLKKAV